MLAFLFETQMFTKKLFYFASSHLYLIFGGGFLVWQREQINLQGLHLMLYNWGKIMQLFSYNL